MSLFGINFVIKVTNFLLLAIWSINVLLLGIGAIRSDYFVLDDEQALLLNSYITSSSSLCNSVTGLKFINK